MPGRLIIEGNSVYEIDEECLERQKAKKSLRETSESGSSTLRCQRAGSGTKGKSR